MKVQGPGAGPPVPEIEGGPGKPEGAAGLDGKKFADKVGLDKSAAVTDPARIGEIAGADKVGGAARVSGTTPPLTADIGAELAARRIAPEAAVDQVIERVLDKQIGANAPAAVREQVGAALRDALMSDPMLLDKVRSLGG